MKLFTTPALKRHPEKHNPYDSYSLVAQPLMGDVGHRYWLCFGTTRRIFNLPLNTTKVWLEFHNRPAVDRWLIEVINMDEALLSIDGNGVLVEDKMVKYLVRRLKREKVYVTCWYEEEGP